jgi:hypothetical protein
LEVPALDAQGALYAEKPDAIVVLARLEELAPDFAAQFPDGGGEATTLLDPVADRLRDLLRSLRAHTSAALFIANFALPERLTCGVGDAMLESSQAAAIHRANVALAAACRSVPGAFVFDYAHVVAEHGLRGWHDPRMLAVERGGTDRPHRRVGAHDACGVFRSGEMPGARCGQYPVGRGHR